MNYTVKQLADLAGVSARTLRYYDQIDLLRPSDVGDNGYRIYDDAAVIRLQQILFYRELDFSLAQIQAILDDPHFDTLQALQTHKQALQKQTRRLHNLIDTIDRTILHIKGELNMNAKELFAAFDEAQQKEYEAEAARRYDPDVVKASSRRWKSYTAAQKAQIMAEGSVIYEDLLAHIDDDPGSDAVQAIVARWHQHIRYFYEPGWDTLRGLGNGYATDPAFAARFEAMHPRFPAFLRDAITRYCDANPKP